MKRTLLQTIFQFRRQACSIESRRPNRKTVLMRVLWLPIMTLAILAGLAAPPANGQSNAPIRIDADIPYEARAPWFNREHTEVVDEVTLRGTMHLSQRIWMSSPTRVRRVTIHLNVVDVHGTSETTGQRFRLNGSHSVDVHDPEGTVSPDGIFTMPLEQIRFFLHKVDPEPASLTEDLWSSQGSIAANVTFNPPPPIPCVRIYLPGGTPTASVNCGNFQLSFWEPPAVYDTRIMATGGSACATTPCYVPDGSILFNGYAGDYNPPLRMRRRPYYNAVTGLVEVVSVQWHCKTGSREVPVILFAGNDYVMCTPLYSATEPITVYAEVTYGVDMYYNGGLNVQYGIVRSADHTFRMLERPTGGSPQISSYDDKAAFLAATDAVIATGPLPNLGVIADSSNPSGSATIGSVTFSLAPGGNNFFIGGLNSDWYRQTPGNEIALGYERLQVTTAAPVFALGFEFIEPNTTMPSWGGSPVDSTYEVTLFTGTTQVAQFTFNAPDDVAPAFVGVWSDTAFDRAVIIDITPDPYSDDDEYFGEFFTGTTPLP